MQMGAVGLMETNFKTELNKDLVNYYASQEHFEGFLALFKAIKYKFSKKNCKLIVKWKRVN